MEKNRSRISRRVWAIIVLGLGVITGSVYEESPEQQGGQPLAPSITVQPARGKKPEPFRQANKALELKFPQVAGFVQAEKHVYDEPEYGYSVGYNSLARVTFTVYVYDAGHASIPNGVTSSPVKTEMENARKEIGYAAQAGHYSNVRELKRDTVKLGTASQAPQVLHIALSMNNQIPEAVFSDIYLTGYKNHFFKIRLTRLRRTAKETQPLVNRMLAKLGAILKK